MSSQMRGNGIWTTGLARLQKVHSVTPYTDFITASFTLKMSYGFAGTLFMPTRQLRSSLRRLLRNPQTHNSIMCRSLIRNCTQIEKQVRKVSTGIRFTPLRERFSRKSQTLNKFCEHLMYRFLSKSEENYRKKAKFHLCHQVKCPFHCTDFQETYNYY